MATICVWMTELLITRAFLLSDCVAGLRLDFTVSCQVGFLLAHQLIFLATLRVSVGEQIQNYIRSRSLREIKKTLSVGLSTYSELRGASGDKPDVFSPSWS